MQIRYLSPAMVLCAMLGCSVSGLALAEDQPSEAVIEQDNLPPADLNTLTGIGYHEITAEKNAVIPDYAVSTKQFELHLSWLQKNGYHFISVTQLIKANEGKAKLPTKPVLLTVDDGYQSFLPICLSNY